MQGRLKWVQHKLQHKFSGVSIFRSRNGLAMGLEGSWLILQTVSKEINIDRSPILKEGSKFKELSKMPTFLSSTIFHALVSKNSIYCRGKNGLFSVICRLIRQVCSEATIVAPNLFFTSQNHFERSKELLKVCKKVSFILRWRQEMHEAVYL